MRRSAEETLHDRVELVVDSVMFASIATARHAGLQILLFTILIVLIAILIQMYAGDKVLAFARQHLHV